MNHQLKSVMLSTRNFEDILEDMGHRWILLKRIPKLQPPYTVYVYNSYPRSGDWNGSSGKVIGQFICTESVKLLKEGGKVDSSIVRPVDLRVVSDYIRNNLKAGRPLFGIRVTSPVRYAEPLPLTAFERWCDRDCYKCKYWELPSLEEPGYCKREDFTITSPPSDWRYVMYKEVI